MADKRIIAIAVSPKAYDEILKLKGDRTWTEWLLELMLLENATNEVLQSELTKPKAIEVPTPISIEKAEPKPKKAKAEAKAETKSEVEPEVEFGKVDPLTGGVPIDIKKIGKNKKAEVEV